MAELEYDSRSLQGLFTAASTFTLITLATPADTVCSGSLIFMRQHCANVHIMCVCQRVCVTHHLPALVPPPSASRAAL